MQESKRLPAADIVDLDSEVLAAQKILRTSGPYASICITRANRLQALQSNTQTQKERNS